MFFHFVKDPTMGRYRRHWHSHLHAVVRTLPMLTWTFPRPQRFFGLSRSFRVIGKASRALPGRLRTFYECILPRLLISDWNVLSFFKRFIASFSNDPFDGVVAMRHFDLVGGYLQARDIVGSGLTIWKGWHFSHCLKHLYTKCIE